MRDTISTLPPTARVNGGRLWSRLAPGVEFDATCIDAVRTAAAALGYDAMDLVSGGRPT